MSEIPPFGQWLKERRRTLDLTQSELAQRVGCSTVTIHKIETGALQPSKDIAERLAVCLDISPGARAGLVHFARTGRLEPSTDGGAAASAPLHGRVPHNLPFPATQLIGRDADLAAIRKRLRDGARLVTLVGPPGVGKTRLALEVAYQSLEAYPDGVFFVYLAPLASAALVPDAIGRTLGVAEARARPLIEQVKARLRDRQVLLVLDNFEHVVAAAPMIAALVIDCPWLTIMVTSRQALRIRGERTYAVSPLTVPATSAAAPALTAAEALHFSAVALFVERAEAAAPGFTLTDVAAPDVGEICRRLDGIPLAIELVAAHTRLLTPGELLERWTGSWFLSSGWLRDGPARHQSLQEAVAWSYRLLDDDEKSLLCRLAVFAGGADLRAIEAVCECHDLACLESLIDKSLVKRVGGPEGEGRYVLLEMIRQYALDSLAASALEVEARTKHAGYYDRLAAEAGVGIKGPEQMSWFRRLEMEQPNLSSALAWGLGCDPHEGRPAVELGLQTALDLFWFWSMHGHLRQGLDWLERALCATESWGDTPERADALWSAGACAGYLGLGRQSRAFFEKCIRMCRSLVSSYLAAGAHSDPAKGLMRTRRALGYALQLRAFFSTARATLTAAESDLEEAVTIMREVADDFDLAHALNSLGHWASRNGAVELARTALEESLALCVQASNLWCGALAFGNLLRVYEYLGEFEKARALLARKGLPAGVVQDLGEMQRIHVVMWWLSYLAGSADDAPQRLEVLRKAVGLQNESGYGSFVEGSLYEAIYLALQAHMLARAVRLAAVTRGWLAALGAQRADPPELAAALDMARRQLGEGLFASAWAEGRAMTIPESAAYALSGEE